MRRSMSLNSAERWELGVFLAMLFVAFLCGAVLLGNRGLPKLFARTTNQADEISVEVEPRPIAPELPATGPVERVEERDANAPELLDMPMIQDAERAKRPAAKADIRYYQGKAYKFTRTLRLRVTAYAPDARCCWPYDGTTTASGLSVKTNRGRLVAADTRVIPMHAMVSVPGYHAGDTVPVLDRGGKIQGHRLDILLPTYDQAKTWGSRVLSVKIYEPLK